MDLGERKSLQYFRPPRNFFSTLSLSAARTPLAGFVNSLPADCFSIPRDRHAVATHHTLCYTDLMLHGRSKPWQISPLQLMTSC